MITLTSSEGDAFQVDDAFATHAVTVRNLLDDTGTTSAVPLPNVSSAALAKVIEFCNSRALPEADREAFDAEYVRVEQSLLFDIILAANYLDIAALLDLTCGAVANLIKGKTPEEIRATFNLPNDLTPEEEEQIRKDNAWAFE